jgi:excisionase family DNA binding protein
MELTTMSEPAPIYKTAKSKRPIPPMSPETDEFFTTEEAAKVLEYTVASVRQMVFKKKIESIRVGRSILIPKKAIYEYKEKTSGMSKNDPRRSIK